MESILLELLLNLAVNPVFGGHKATPHPARQAGKTTPTNAREQTPKSEAKVSYQSRNRYDLSLYVTF